MNTSVGREPHALSVEFGTDTLVVHLEDGRSLSAPLEWFPSLRDASEADRNRWRLIGRAVGIHWETLDEDLSVRGLLEGAWCPDRVLNALAARGSRQILVT
jgi:hypothetical protein